MSQWAATLIYLALPGSGMCQVQGWARTGSWNTEKQGQLTSSSGVSRNSVLLLLLSRFSRVRLCATPPLTILLQISKGLKHPGGYFLLPRSCFC